MCDKIKIKAKIRQYRSVPISVVKETYDNKRTLSNTMCVLIPLLKHLGMPEDEIQYDEILRRSTEVIHFLAARYTNPRVYLKYICSVLTRTGFGKYHKLTELVDLQYPEVKQDGAKDVPSWTGVILPLMRAASKDRELSTVVRIITTLYKHGYVFRPAQIFNTSVSVDGADGENYLDLSTGQYKIYSQKNGKHISFFLPSELTDALREFAGDKYLIEHRGKKWSEGRCRNFKYHGFNIPYDIHDIRHSYDTWLHRESGLSNGEIAERDRILGHSVSFAKQYYVEASDESGSDE